VTTLNGAAEVYAIIVNLVEHVDDVVQLSTILLLELLDFTDVVLTNDSGTLLDHKGSSYAIKLEPSTTAPFSPLYNLSLKELGVLREYLADA
jgi:hypothetical protein